jgi:hypothetical protein
MAVPIKFFSVIVPKHILEQKYDGGLAQYEADCPNRSLLIDNDLTRVGFMDDVALHNYCENLISKGLHFNEATKSSTDFVVVQRLQGKQWKADWLDVRDTGYAYYV